MRTVAASAKRGTNGGNAPGVARGAGAPSAAGVPRNGAAAEAATGAAGRTAPRPPGSGPGGGDGPPKGLGAAQERWDFYRDESNRKNGQIKGLLVALVVAVGMYPVFYYAAKGRDNVIGYDSATGRMTRIPTLEEPHVSPATVRQFCAESVQEIGTFGFSDYDMRLRKLQDWFTDPAWRAYLNALRDRNRRKSVEDNTQTWATQAIQPCAILDHKPKDGRYWWLVQAQVRRVINSGNQFGAPKEFPITMEIVRVGAGEGKKDMIAIDTYREP
ncbi:DotI/IcmL/TraM family protein [Azospirillum canadense]|uniref:DotI/IcmL/TraM family protein n=1 Tax=Azospirillum canadense TaxID=403962 RepID=UPI002228028A|nr:DotI/IcmL/TraM family protein [Azospirillum canadense]MCW2240378.1 hypothetical protein [Azospirillum canadense]